MISAFSTQHKFQLKRDETLLLQTDLSKANTVIPKPIQWKDVNLPDEWILEGATAPVIPKQLEPNTELQNVTQYSDDNNITYPFKESNPITIRKKATEWNLSSSGRVIESEHPPLRSLTIEHGAYFQPFEVSKTSQKLVQESKSNFAKAIRDQLDRIEASSSSSKVQIAPDSAQSSKIGVLEQDNMSIASSDIEAFKEEPVSKATKIHWELALPTVKSPPDLTIDNRPAALNQSCFNASSVYEWNIDAIAEILIAGFTGQLKGWWDHLLTKQQQLDILNSIQVDENGAPILDEFNSPIQDAVATLILTISLHFIGDPSHLRDKNAELLHNLRCRKLSEFQSYKTTFFARIFLRDDANHITWKEKFLAGLPTLLGEKVRNSIKALYDNRIPYDERTYGELVSFVNKEGLKICQDLKLQKCLKWELRNSKQELGSFFAPLLIESSDSESSMTGDSDPLQIDELLDSDTSESRSSDFDMESCNTLGESHIGKARERCWVYKGAAPRVLLSDGGANLSEDAESPRGGTRFGVYGCPKNKSVRGLLRPKADNILPGLGWVMTLWYQSGSACPLERWWGKLQRGR
ncbi:hypothetical protein KPL70_007306 [Citrus sinensis]|nr:hypothetical protein KPL70_007306 [Citrus sinensis]